MNKTIIININGIIFHIEEDAYETLKTYITGIKRHFAGSTDSHEITTDIENRIAEMFSDILKNENKEVIFNSDVTSVIAQMGTIEDFSSDTADDASFTTETSSTYHDRRLYRDPDDHLIGGVAAGIANYFGVDTVWIRLLFVLTTFGAGGGLILYAVLWAIIPRANTRAEKMAMKGEKADLQGFKKNFEDELRSVRQSLSNANREAKPILYKLRDFVGEFFLLLQSFLRGSGRIILVVLGVLICVACILGIVALLITITVFAANKSMFTHGFSPFNIVNYQFSNILYICGFLVCAVPLLGLALLTIRVVFSRQPFGRSVGFVLLIVWIAALSTTVFYATKIASDFKTESSFSQTQLIYQNPANHYYLQINNAKILTHDDSLMLGIDKQPFMNDITINLNDNNDNDLSPENVKLYIEKSEDSTAHLIETYRAKGADYQQALLNARNTVYNYAQQDTVIKFDRKLKPLKNTLWRDQRLDLSLKLPLNALVTIDEDVDYILRDLNLWDCYPDGNDQRGKRQATFKMTETGLVCLRDSSKKEDKNTQQQ